MRVLEAHKVNKIPNKVGTATKVSRLGMVHHLLFHWSTSKFVSYLSYFEGAFVQSAEWILRYVAILFDAEHRSQRGQS